MGGITVSDLWDSENQLFRGSATDGTAFEGEREVAKDDGTGKCAARDDGSG